MRMFFESSDSRISSKTSLVVELSNLGVEKPPSLKETCPVEITEEHFPGLEKCQKTSQCDKNIDTKHKKSSKVLVNLPKIKLKEISQQRIDAGEPFGDQYILPKSTSWKDKFTANLEKNAETVPSVPLINYEKSILENFKGSSNPGPSECQLSFVVPESEENVEDFDPEEEKLEESKALKRWEFWMKDKKKIQNQLQKRLNTSAGNLQIQESDKYRQMVEDKLLLSYVQLPKADKWRGHPYRWKAKVRLGEGNINNSKFENAPQYTAVKTQIQEGKSPEMEFIGMPKPIQVEKGLTSGLENIATAKQAKLSYRAERISYYKKFIKQLKPHNIQMDELVVIGKQIPKPQEVEEKESILFSNLPEINVEAEWSEQNCFDYRQSIFCLSIEGEEIKYELGANSCQSPDKVFTWLVDFGVSAVGSLVEKVLKVENRGTVTVSYNWLSYKFEQNQCSKPLTLKHHQPWFFFNKNSGFFLPGQIYDLKFYLKAETYGVRKEIWHLQSTPPLSKNPHGATIILSAIATDDFVNQNNENNDLESYLSKRVRHSVAAFILEVILYKVFNSHKERREIEYRSIFFEKDLFEYHNPYYYYHSTVLRDLKEVFKQVPQNSQAEWDLSLKSLVSLIQNFSSGDERKSLFSTVVESAKKLSRPNYLPVKKSKTFIMSYNILCKMANFMEEDYDCIKKLLSEKKETVFGKTWLDHEETEEFTSSSGSITEEIGEIETNNAMVLLEIKPMNYLYFQTMFYLKVHHRVCQAVEQIVGVLETSKLFDPWKKVTHKLEKPSRTNICVSRNGFK